MSRTFADRTVRSERADMPRRRLATIGSPAVWGLGLALMLLPFLSVSCDTPGGFGRMEAGGTTTWSGIDLALGTEPGVDESHLRPVAEQQSDDVGWQPLIAAGALALAAAIVVVRLRPALAAGIGLAAAAAFAIGLLVARAEVVDRVAEQARETFPPGTSAGDHVAVGVGFWGTLALALVGAVLAMLGSRPARRPATRAAESNDGAGP